MKAKSSTTKSVVVSSAAGLFLPFVGCLLFVIRWNVGYVCSHVHVSYMCRVNMYYTQYAYKKREQNRNYNGIRHTNNNNNNSSNKKKTEQEGINGTIGEWESHSSGEKKEIPEPCTEVNHSFDGNDLRKNHCFVVKPNNRLNKLEKTIDRNVRLATLTLLSRVRTEIHCKALANHYICTRYLDACNHSLIGMQRQFNLVTALTVRSLIDQKEYFRIFFLSLLLLLQVDCVMCVCGGVYFVREHTFLSNKSRTRQNWKKKFKGKNVQKKKREEYNTQFKRNPSMCVLFTLYYMSRSDMLNNALLPTSTIVFTYDYGIIYSRPHLMFREVKQFTQLLLMCDMGGWLVWLTLFHMRRFIHFVNTRIAHTL